MKAILTLKRDTYTSKTTIGKLYLNDVFICDTLEDVCRDINKDGDLDDKGETKVYGETAIPTEVVDTKFGSLFNGTEFIYFESDEERIDYLKQLNVENGVI